MQDEASTGDIAAGDPAVLITGAWDQRSGAHRLRIRRQANRRHDVSRW